MSNPTICLKHGSHLMWKVSNTDFPKYVKNNLYNTNPSFDEGPFKALEEKHQLESTKFELFAYRFDVEGVYVFTSSANPESTMVSCVYWQSDYLFCYFNIKTQMLWPFTTNNHLWVVWTETHKRTKLFIFLVVRQNGWLDWFTQRRKWKYRTWNFVLQFVRVMAKGADCAENGPFFPTTPRNVIQNGIAIARDIVVMPDWVLIGAMLGSFALLMIILVIGLVSLVFFCSVPRNGFCVQTSFVIFRNC